MKKIFLVLLLLNFITIAGGVSEKTRPSNNMDYKGKIIDIKIEKGLNYLYNSQLPDGQFPVYLSFYPDMSNLSNLTSYFGNVSIIFDTGLILHTLNLADNDRVIKNKKINEMKIKAVNYLLNNMEQQNVWRFFGKYNSGNTITFLPPDTDDTSVVYAALVESEVNISDESLDNMLNYRTDDGTFYVWINSEEWLNSSNPYYKGRWISNEIDPVVNVNVLYAYSLRNISQNGVIKYLNGIFKNESFKNGSRYYPSPYVFNYMVTKAYYDGNIKELKPYLDDIKEYLLETQNSDGGWGNDLESALATNALINMGYKGEKLEKAIEHILQTQKDNGNWDIYGFYSAYDTVRFGEVMNAGYFGSHALTTSYSLEALMKYRRLRAYPKSPDVLNVIQICSSKGD